MCISSSRVSSTGVRSSGIVGISTSDPNPEIRVYISSEKDPQSIRSTISRYLFFIGCTILFSTSRIISVFDPQTEYKRGREPV